MTKQQQQEMVTRAYMEEQINKMISGYDAKIATLLAALEDKVATPAPAAPVVQASAPVPTPAAPAAEAPLTDAEKLALVQQKDAELMNAENTLLMQLAATTDPTVRAQLRKQLNATSSNRKLTLEYIRKSTANGLRTYADVQETTLNNLINWTRDGLVTLVDLAANGAKAVNTGVANGVRFTADVVDPDVAAFDNINKPAQA